ncbi:MAG TPA: Wzz/FepE/Etk N-terminal domain-containing protein, partial [Candidatus Aquilonibacter sp.]|nr:Wzz/FepE/Etk N-terminal domain-containing protein [Candidatus Aquilonibacter sp.]
MHAFPNNATPVALPGSVEPNAAVNGASSELASLWRTIVRRRTTVLRIFVGFVVLMMIGTLIWPKQYTTSIKVIAGNNSGASTSSSAGGTDLPVLNAFVIANGMQSSETYVELFKESPVVQRVIKDLGLKTSARALLSHVVVSPVTNTNIVSVAVTWSDRVTSAKIANAFGQAIVDRQRELVSSQANSAIASLKQQMPAAQARMNDAQNKLASFEAQHRIADIDEQTKGT